MSASVRYCSDEQFGVSVKPMLGVRGTKYATCVLIDSETIRVVQLPLRDFDRSLPVVYHGGPYPVARFIDSVLAMTKRRIHPLEITQGALETLERARLQGDTPIEDTPEAPPAAPVPAPPKRQPGTNLLRDVCAELKVEPGAARRLLRKAGLSAPYLDEKAIRSVLK